MKKYNITLLLLFFELSCLHGHAIFKRELNNVDTYKVKEDTDTLEIINPKAKKPTLREIIYYHVIEKPYSEKHMSEENNSKTQINDVTRPFTNGHGFQYLNENKYDEIDSNGDKQPQSHENELKLQIEDENEPKIPTRDEIGDDLKRPDEIHENEPKLQKEDENEPKMPTRDEIGDDLKRPDEIHHDEINDSIKDEIMPNDEVIDKGTGPISEKIAATRRRKREIDYSSIPPAPTLPPFRMDILPDYIKAILPDENEPTFTLKTPTFKPWSTERPGASISVSEEPEINTKESVTTETKVPRITIRIDGDEETDHNIIKKSTINVDDDIEQQLREVIDNLSDDDNRQKLYKQSPPLYGMDLTGNSGTVWNDLNNHHLQFNVGLDAYNEEIHDEQIPTKPHEVTNNNENDEITNEIVTTLNEIEHILDEINEETTESNDIEIIIDKNKHKEKQETYQNDDKFDKSEKKDIVLRDKELKPKIDQRSSFHEDNDKVAAKSVVDPENSIDLETALSFLEVLQNIIANANNSVLPKDGKKDDLKVLPKNTTDDEPERDKKHHNNKGEDGKNNGSCKKNDIDDLLNNDKYWNWLKDSSQAALNLLMKRINGLIKEEVEQQIQALVTKMMEGHPETNEPENDNVETKPTSDVKHEETKISGDNNGEINVTTEESDINPQVLDKLMKNDKWTWLTNSSEVYLGTLMKRINKQIEEEVTKQVEYLMKYHMPNANQTEPGTNDNQQNTTEIVDINPSKDESKKNTDKEPNNDSINANDKNESSETDDDHKLEDEVKAKSHKAINGSQKHTNKKKIPLINIEAENSYGSSVGNEKVTNIFIFNVNGSDLKNLKPISSGNGMFIFGTDKNNNSAETNNNNNQEVSEKPVSNENNEQTESPNTNSTTDSNVNEITVAPEEMKPVDKVEKPNSETNKNMNQNTTSSPVDEIKDISELDSSNSDKKDEDVKNADSKDAEEINDGNINKEKDKSEENPVKSEKTEDESIKTDNKSTEDTKTESNDDTTHNSSTEDEASETKKMNEDQGSKMSDKNDEVKSESKDGTD